MTATDAFDLLGRAWCHLAQQTNLLRDNEDWDANMDARVLVSKLRRTVMREAYGENY